MTHRLLFKFVFVIAILLFMVLMGMSNQDMVKFRLTPLGFESGQIQSALMYFVFFCTGLLTGGVLALGTGKSGGSKKKES